MIINIRGTSGSGKSHLVREIMQRYDCKLAVKHEGRKRPIGYLCKRAGQRDLAVLGHYETPCGGCDTIPSMETIFALVRQSHYAGADVLFEGLIVNSDRNRTIRMHEDDLPLKIITLSTSIDLCLESIGERRKSKGNAKPLNPRNTEAKFKLALTNHQRFLDAGLDTHLLTRDEAWCLIIELLEL